MHLTMQDQMQADQGYWVADSECDTMKPTSGELYQQRSTQVTGNLTQLCRCSAPDQLMPDLHFHCALESSTISRSFAQLNYEVN